MATRRGTRKKTAVHTLCIDIGGSGLKASVVDTSGTMLVDRVRVETPREHTAQQVVRALVKLVKPLPAFHRISVGFPGVVRDGHVVTAPNLGTRAWAGFDLAGALEKELGKPVRVANDADVQGLAVIQGKGLEMVVTLGTGFGTALYLHGRLAPHLEISQIPFRQGETFDEQIGNNARRKVGDERWNRRVRKAITIMRTLTNFDLLYIGGGNTKHLTFKLPEQCTIVGNEAGILGGVRLWEEETPP